MRIYLHQLRIQFYYWPYQKTMKISKLKRENTMIIINQLFIIYVLNTIAGCQLHSQLE
jgi:hypothetical protein